MRSLALIGAIAVAVASARQAPAQPDGDAAGDGAGAAGFPVLEAPSLDGLAIDWDARFYNPAPADDGADYIVPLPCGGALTFRWVRTPADANWLDDREVLLGSTDIDASFEEYAHIEHLVGSLSANGGPTGRGILMGKYEVTRDQYDAVMTGADGACPEPSMAGRRPAGMVSWFDAVAFTRELTQWLIASHPETLPGVGQYRGFVRLPTEVEWEYSLRGGTAVSDAAFLAPRPPLAEGIDAHAWSQGPSSCAGSLRPVGLLRPNPLGLHDMLGNVEEMMLEPFRASRFGRLHGQIGGMVVRGGSCLTPASRLTSSLRTEYAYFDATTGEALAFDTLGFRVTISAPVIASDRRLADMEADWQDLFTLRDGAVEVSDPLAALAGLVDREDDPRIRDTLEAIVAGLREELAGRNDLEDRALRTAITAAAALIRNYRQLHQVVWRDGQILPVIRAGSDAAAIAAIEGRLEDNRAHLDATGAVYLDLLLRTASDYDRDAIAAQANWVIDRYRDIESDTFAAFVTCFARQTDQFARHPSDILLTYLDALIGVGYEVPSCGLDPATPPPAD